MAHVDDSSVSNVVSPQGYNRQKQNFRPTFPEAFSHALKLMLARFRTRHDLPPSTNKQRRGNKAPYYLFDPAAQSLVCPKACCGCHHFLLSNFKYFLTLFSKFFSSFPHGTCSLSVSRKYLALEEIYLPFRAAIPNNSTL